MCNVRALMRVKQQLEIVKDDQEYLNEICYSDLNLGKIVAYTECLSLINKEIKVIKEAINGL